MDVLSMCSSSPNQSIPRKTSVFAPSTSHAQSLPSPPLVEMANEKKGHPLPSLTSILRSPVPSLHEISSNPPAIMPKPLHNTSSASIVNLQNSSYQQRSSTPPSPPSQLNYQKPPLARRSSFSSSPSYSLPPPRCDTTSSMWSRQQQPQQPPPPPSSSYYQHQHSPPTQYQYASQSQQQRFTSNYSHSSVTTSSTSDYPPPYATSTSYTSTGNNIPRDEDSPYIQQTTEQSLVKIGKVIDNCNQIAQFASQYRDMKINHNPWNGIVLQLNESHLTDMINKAYDVLNVLSGLKSEVSARFHAETSQDEIDLIRKQRTSISTSTRTKYRKRSKRAAPPGRCHSCNISETPEWRRGPDGARTLCNACGLPNSSNMSMSSSSSSLDNNINGSIMSTPGVSDIERDSPHAKRARIDMIDMFED
ncbi:8801_t:CDS:2 [Funneliformis caledonium]|uniref:8801_t:CDS:1 n=1 Tax=Funneliformis caledonium TaxID=1117310 RepID=A0A9N8VQH1_9GLOM|nr:8801_t:CDS:2 [Funneliformis caledonium]